MAVGVGVLVGSGVLVGVAVSVAAGVARTSYCRSTWTVSPHQKSVEFTIEQLVFRAGGFLGFGAENMDPPAFTTAHHHLLDWFPAAWKRNNPQILANASLRWVKLSGTAGLPRPG